MSYHYSRILLPMTAVADLESTDTDCGGHLLYTIVNLVGTRLRRQVTHAWVSTPLEILVHGLRH